MDKALEDKFNSAKERIENLAKIKDEIMKLEHFDDCHMASKVTKIGYGELEETLAKEVVEVGLKLAISKRLSALEIALGCDTNNSEVGCEVK